MILEDDNAAILEEAGSGSGGAVAAPTDATAAALPAAAAPAATRSSGRTMRPPPASADVAHSVAADDLGAVLAETPPPSAGASDDGGRIHRSLPRTKTMLADEAYLSGILHILEQSGAPNFPYASTSNGWTTAFHNVYSALAVDCHHPTGKNRHHKFKDKVVEIWTAMEAEVLAGRQSAASNPLYALGLKQLEAYRAATTAAAAASSSNGNPAADEAQSPEHQARGVEGGGARAAAAPASASAASTTIQSSGNTASAAIANASSEDPVRPPPPPRRGRPPKFRALPNTHNPSSSSSSTAMKGAAATAATATTEASSSAVATAAASLSSSSSSPAAGRIVSGQALMQVVARLDRLEAMAFDSFRFPSSLVGGGGSGSHQQSKAMEQSPHLQQLHRLWVQNRRGCNGGVAAAAGAVSAAMRRSHNADAILPYYKSAVRTYLSMLSQSQQCKSSGELEPSDGVADAAVVDDLYASLQEMEALLQATEGISSRSSSRIAGTVTTGDLASEIHEAYKTQLSSYLEAVNLGLTAELEAQKNRAQEQEQQQDPQHSASTTTRKRPAAEGAMEDDGIGDEDLEGEHQGMLVDV